MAVRRENLLDVIDKFIGPKTDVEIRLVQQEDEYKYNVMAVTKKRIDEMVEILLHPSQPDFQLI